MTGRDTPAPGVARESLTVTVAALLHDRAHNGWHRWSADGRECPDGRADADAWLPKAETLIHDLGAADLVLHENAGECYVGDRFLATPVTPEGGELR